jgi:hypothetical protein
MVANSPRYADLARFGDTFESSSDIYPVTMDIAFLDDHITEVDTDPEDDTLPFGHVGIAFGHALLHRDGAGNRFDHARELD